MFGKTSKIYYKLKQSENWDFKYEPDSYNHSKTVPQCRKCGSDTYPKTNHYKRNGHGDYISVISCFGCAEPCQECICKKDTDFRLPIGCTICHRRGSLTWERRAEICDDYCRKRRYNKLFSHSFNIILEYERLDSTKIKRYFANGT